MPSRKYDTKLSRILVSSFGIIGELPCSWWTSIAKKSPWRQSTAHPYCGNPVWAPLYGAPLSNTTKLPKPSGQSPESVCAAVRKFKFVVIVENAVPLIWKGVDLAARSWFACSFGHRRLYCSSISLISGRHAFHLSGWFKLKLVRRHWLGGLIPECLNVDFWLTDHLSKYPIILDITGFFLPVSVPLLDPLAIPRSVDECFAKSLSASNIFVDSFSDKTFLRNLRRSSPSSV